MIRTVVAVFLGSWAFMGYSATVECDGVGYARGLCLYSNENWIEADAELSRVVEAGRAERETLKAMYFLARTKMQMKQWDQASQLWVRLFSLSPAFYREWNGDYLLGECRRNRGLE